MDKIVVKIDRKSIKHNPDYGRVSRQICTNKRITLTTDRRIEGWERQLKSAESGYDYLSNTPRSKFVYFIDKGQAQIAASVGLGIIDVEQDCQTYWLGHQPKYLYNHCKTGYFSCPSCGTYQYLKAYQREDFEGRGYAYCPRCKTDVDIEYEQL